VDVRFDQGVEQIVTLFVNALGLKDHAEAPTGRRAKAK
jgi:hypothetical protein